MRYVIIALLTLVVATAPGQVTVTGTVPANGATSVPLNAVLSITFSAAIDTTQPFLPGEQFLTNVDSVNALWWSADRRTFSAAAVLKPNSAYFVLVMMVHPAGGGSLQQPYAVHWSTGATFPANHYSVSGSILSGSTGVSPANAIVAISATSIMTQGDPEFLAADVADQYGNFTIPYVPGVQGYPIAAKDANGDGQIDPSKGDVIAEGAPITPTGNLTGITLTFVSFKPLTWEPARDAALAFAGANLPAERQLRQVTCWEVDTTGAASDWEFIYTVPGTPRPYKVRVGVMATGFDSDQQGWDWVWSCKPMPSPLTAVIADTVIARAERAGGRLFRQQKPSDNTIESRIGLYLGQLTYTNFWMLAPDSTKFYWGVEYRYDRRVTPDSTTWVAHKLFLADWSTGNILGVTGVDEKIPGGVAESYRLDQNYPNPFNPSTTIAFGVPERSQVSLLVYNTLGQIVARLVSGEVEAGYHQVKFDGSSLPSGVYFYRLQSGGYAESKKLILMK